MEEDVEYLSTWPPPARLEEAPLVSELNSQPATIVSAVSLPPPKRFKHELEYEASERLGLDKSTCCHSENGSPAREELQQQLSPEELHIVHCDCSVSADALLARWWKMASKKSEHNVPWVDAQEERVVSVIKSSATGPQTQLYHISR